MGRDVRLEKLTRNGIELMRREREMALKCDLAGLATLNVEKTAFLGSLEALRLELDSGGPAPLLESRKRELATLFDIMRRRAEENEALLRAAEKGVRSAARRIEQLFDAGAKTVAYDAQGGRLENKSAQANTSERI